MPEILFSRVAPTKRAIALRALIQASIRLSELCFTLNDQRRHEQSALAAATFYLTTGRLLELSGPLCDPHMVAFYNPQVRQYASSCDLYLKQVRGWRKRYPRLNLSWKVGV